VAAIGRTNKQNDAGMRLLLLQPVCKLQVQSLCRAQPIGQGSNQVKHLFRQRLQFIRLLQRVFCRCINASQDMMKDSKSLFDSLPHRRRGNLIAGDGDVFPDWLGIRVN